MDGGLWPTQRCCCGSTQRADTLRTPKHESLYRHGRRLLLLFNTTHMVPGPPSTGVAIAMDGGMAAAAAQHNAHTRPDPKQQARVGLDANFRKFFWK